jgi:hypothetical protein
MTKEERIEHLQKRVDKANKAHERARRQLMAAVAHCENCFGEIITSAALLDRAKEAP